MYLFRSASASIRQTSGRCADDEHSRKKASPFESEIYPSHKSGDLYKGYFDPAEGLYRVFGLPASHSIQRKMPAHFSGAALPASIGTAAATASAVAKEDALYATFSTREDMTFWYNLAKRSTAGCRDCSVGSSKRQRKS